MKKLLFFLTMVCLGGMIVMSCNRENGSNTGGDKKIAIQYQLKNVFTQNGATQQLTPCFHYNIRYVDDTGKTVELNNVSAPWNLPAFEIKTPFTAKIEGTIVYNESEIPETGPIYFGVVPNIHTTENGVEKDYGLNDSPVGQFSSKEQFLTFIASHPERLKFTLEHTF